MIPQTIHYCWFGENKMPALAIKCMESWQRYFPGWEIRLWNEQNTPMQFSYVQFAYQNKKWSNLSNFIRLHALKNYGGIYLDTDIEVIKTFDFLNNYNCFIGFENSKTGNDMSVNNALIGAVINHPFVERCYNYLLQEFDGVEESNLSGPGIATSILKEEGLITNREQDINDVHVFSREAFHPFDWDEVFTYSCVMPATYAIHYWNLSWKDTKNELISLYLEKLKLIAELQKAENAIADFKNGKIKTKELLKTNYNFLRHTVKK